MSIQEYQLTKINISDLHFDESNPNQLTKEQEAALKKAMKRFGYLVPIVINENYEIGDGEHRARLYKEMGLTEIPAYIVPKINDDIERRLLRQTMNKLRGEHEIKMDADEIALIFQNNKLNDLTELLATQRNELEDILTKHKGIQFQREDNFDVDKELEDLVPVTELGDIWQLGNHRIACGDNSDDRIIKKLLEDQTVDMVFTDPPYNMMGSSHGHRGLDDDNIVMPFFRGIASLIKNTLRQDGHGYIFCNWRSYPPIASAFKESNLTPKNLIVWHKPNLLVGNMYASSHEFIYFIANENIIHLKPSHPERHVRTIYGETNVWTYDMTTQAERKQAHGNEGEHKTMAVKPVKLIQRALNNSTDENELVFDPFLGSGSTLIACEQTNRICYGVEIDPRYIDIIIKRYQGLTGKDAIRLKDNKTYNELKLSE